MSREPHTREEEALLPERRESLWLLIAGPMLWAGHFLLSYVTVAVWCAKPGLLPWGPTGARALVGLYTLGAVAAIASVAFIGWRHHSWGEATLPHDYDTPGDRHRFLGFATLLLAGLSLVATLYVGLAALLTRSCG